MNQCGLCERELETGYLCAGCALGTARRLDRMPALYAGLAAFLRPSGRRPELGRTRPVEAPMPIAEPAFNLRGPGGIVRALSINLDWIAASWPMAGAFADEIRGLERDVASIVNPPVPSLRLGNCPAVFQDGALCGAVLRVPHGTAKVECRWCGTVYPPESWLALASNAWTEPDAHNAPETRAS
jgi:hypothetical protein